MYPCFEDKLPTLIEHRIIALIRNPPKDYQNEVRYSTRAWGRNFRVNFLQILPYLPCKLQSSQSIFHKNFNEQIFYFNPSKINFLPGPKSLPGSATFLPISHKILSQTRNIIIFRLHDHEVPGKCFFFKKKIPPL